MCTLNTVSIRVCMCIHAIYTHIFTRIVILLAPICSAFYDRHIRRYILHTTLSTFDLTSNNVHVKACESQFWRLSVSQTESGNRLHLCKVMATLIYWNMNGYPWESLDPKMYDLHVYWLPFWPTKSDSLNPLHPNQTAQVIPDEPRSLRWGQDFVVSLPLNQP